MSKRGIERPLEVIESCVRVEQLGVAQLYAVRWLKFHGLPKHGETAGLIFRAAHFKLAALAGWPKEQSKAGAVLRLRRPGELGNHTRTPGP